MFWLTDSGKGEVIYVSAAYEATWGRTRESLYATPGQWIDAIHADDRERVREVALSKQASGESDEDYGIVRPDGIRCPHPPAPRVQPHAGAASSPSGCCPSIRKPGVIYVSGYVDDALLRHGVSRSEVHYLEKPYSPVALASKLREVIGT